MTSVSKDKDGSVCLKRTCAGGGEDFVLMSVRSVCVCVGVYRMCDVSARRDVTERSRGINETSNYRSCASLLSSSFSPSSSSSPLTNTRVNGLSFTLPSKLSVTGGDFL